MDLENKHNLIPLQTDGQNFKLIVCPHCHGDKYVLKDLVSSFGPHDTVTKVCSTCDGLGSVYKVITEDDAKTTYKILLTE